MTMLLRDRDNSRDTSTKYIRVMQTVLRTTVFGYAAIVPDGLEIKIKFYGNTSYFFFASFLLLFAYLVNLHVFKYNFI